MSPRPSDLPDYDHPPLAEVALTVQFDPISGFSNVHAGLFWARVRDRFPRVEEHPEIDVAIETETHDRFPGVEMRIQLVQAPGVPRFFFVTESGSELVQLQNNRFSHNWRKQGTGEAYPRYERIAPTFATELHEFDRFLGDEKLGGITPVQCEITYVNHIEREGATGVLIDDLLEMWPAGFSKVAGVALEDARLDLKHRLPTADGTFAGRLYVSVKPALRKADRAPLYVLELTARGRPEDSTITGAMKFLDTHRVTLAMAFAQVTSEKMQLKWGRRGAR